MVILRIRAWFATPLMIPRWMIMVLYLLFLLLSVVTVLRGFFGILTYDGWARWALALLVMLSSIVSCVLASRDSWAKFEQWSSLGVISGMAGYIGVASFSAHDGGSWYTLILLVFVTALVVGRWWTLLGVRK